MVSTPYIYVTSGQWGKMGMQCAHQDSFTSCGCTFKPVRHVLSLHFQTHFILLWTIVWVRINHKWFLCNNISFVNNMIFFSAFLFCFYLYLNFSSSLSILLSERYHLSRLSFLTTVYHSSRDGKGLSKHSTSLFQ